MIRHPRGAPGRRLATLALGAALALLPRPVRAQDALAGAAPAPGAGDSASVAPVAAPASTVSPAAPPNAPAVVGKKKVRLIGKDNVARSGPGDGFAIVGVYPKDAEFQVIAKSGEWYDLRLSDQETGWIHASLCRELDDLSGLEFRPNPKLYTRTGSYVLSGYAGAYAFDRKSNSLVLGGRLGYYVFDRILAEAGVSWTHVQRSQEIVESLFGLSLEAEDFPMLFYQLNLGWELLPGRQMVPFVGGGVGSSILLGRSEPSLNFGAGTRMFVSKRAAVRWEFRDYRFHTGSGSSRLTNNNVEFSIGSEILF